MSSHEHLWKKGFSKPNSTPVPNPLKIQRRRFKTLPPPLSPQGKLRLKQQAEQISQLGYNTQNISNPELYEQVMKRYDQRLNEYRDFRKKVNRLQETGQFRVENGVVIDPKNDLGVTGDYDIFDIQTLDGKPIDPKKRNAVIRDLEKEPVAVQHGYHMEWEPTDEVEATIKQNIINAHKEGANGERLADFHPDGSVESKFYEN